MKIPRADIYFRIPRRPLLDTNVAQLLWSFPSLIFERAENDIELTKLARLSTRMQKDVYALSHLMALGRRGAFDFVISPRTVRELKLTRGLKAKGLRNWARKVMTYSLGVIRGARLTSRLRLLGHRSQVLAESSMLAFLPDRLDRLLVADAFCLRADAFLTTDYRTVLRYKTRLKSLGLPALSPETYSRLWKPLEALYL